MTSLILEARFEFVGQNSASEKPVQDLATFAQSSGSGLRSVDAAIRRRSAGRNSPQGLFLNIEGRLAARAKLSPFSLKPEKQH